MKQKSEESNKVVATEENVQEVTTDKTIDIVDKDGFLNLDWLKEKLTRKIFSSRKVNEKNRESVGDWVNIIIEGIKYINSIPENAEIADHWNRSMEKIEVPEDFKWMVRPRAIRLVPGNRNTTNLMVKHNSQGKPLVCTEMKPSVSYIDYTDAIDNINRIFRSQDTPSITNASVCRVELSFSEALPNMMVGKHVRNVEGIGLIPYSIVDDELIKKFYRNVYSEYSYSLEDAVCDFIDNLKF
jgi:hypothetical protein